MGDEGINRLAGGVPPALLVKALPMAEEVEEAPAEVSAKTPAVAKAKTPATAKAKEPATAKAKTPATTKAKASAAAKAKPSVTAKAKAPGTAKAKTAAATKAKTPAAAKLRTRTIAAAKTAAAAKAKEDLVATTTPAAAKALTLVKAPVGKAKALTAEETKAKARELASTSEVKVRRMHRRDLNRTWEFLKLVFRDVNRETVEYQRPRSKLRFVEVYEEDGEQLLFEIGDQIVGYVECAFDASGADNWINPRYFDKRGMRPLYVDELAVHPDYQGYGVGGFMLDQAQHLARVRGCTHLVLEVAENNKSALSWYHKRNFFRLDAAIFLAQKVPAEPELLPSRRIPMKRGAKAVKPAKGSKRTSRTASTRQRRK